MVVQQQLKQVCDDFNLLIFTTNFTAHSDLLRHMLEQIWTLDKNFVMKYEKISFITFNNFDVHLI